MKSSSNEPWHFQKQMCENNRKEYIQQLTQCKETVTSKFRLCENRLSYVDQCLKLKKKLVE